MDVAFGHPRSRNKQPFSFVQGFDFNEQFDALNFQSDGEGNFILNGTSVVEWKDLSPNNRNARQPVSASRPTYGVNGVTFDGSNDFLQLDEDLSYSTFSLYVVLKATAWGDCLCGSIHSRNDFVIVSSAGSSISMAQSGSQTQNAVLGIDQNRFNLLSIRRNERGLLTVEMNDRVCGLISNTVTLSQLFGYIGKNSTGNNWTGSFKAFCLASRYIDDGTHLKIKNEFYNRYNCPESTYGCIIGMGDSITAAANSWIDQLGTDLTRATVKLGISGSRLTWEGGIVNNIRSRFSSTAISRPFKDKLVILAGTNDISLGGVSAANFGIELDQHIQGLINNKYFDPTDICLCSTPYQQAGANAATLVQYQTQISTIATNYGTKYADVYQAMLDYPGGGDLLMTDALHPNATGQTLIEDTILAAVTGW